MAETKVKKTPTKTEAKSGKSVKAAPVAGTTEVATKLHRRTMTGIVVSDKMMKTRVVRIERQVKDEMYGKYITKANKFKIHDEENRSKTGDLVTIVESRPLSREKRWALQSIVRTAHGEVLNKG